MDRGLELRGSKIIQELLKGPEADGHYRVSTDRRCHIKSLSNERSYINQVKNFSLGSMNKMKNGGER